MVSDFLNLMAYDVLQNVLSRTCACGLLLAGRADIVEGVRLHLLQQRVLEHQDLLFKFREIVPQVIKAALLQKQQVCEFGAPDIEDHSLLGEQHPWIEDGPAWKPLDDELVSLEVGEYL